MCFQELTAISNGVAEPELPATAKEDIDWEEDRNALEFIAKCIKTCTGDISSAYLELIAIKPSFHEIWIHDDYFENVPNNNEKPRDVAFRILRCQNDGNEELALDQMPKEINKGDYYTYVYQLFFILKNDYMIDTFFLTGYLIRCYTKILKKYQYFRK